MAEPVFPKPEGPAPTLPHILPVGTPVDDGGKAIAPVAVPSPPGADGFAAQTFVEVTENTAGDVIAEVVTIDEGAVFIEQPAQSGSVPGLASDALIAPNLANFVYTDDAYPNGRVQWQVFIPRRTVTIAGISFYATNSPNNPAQEIEVAIFEHGVGDSKLRGGGAGVSGRIWAAHTWVRTNLDSPLTLLAGTIYRIAFWQRNSSSASVALMLLACGSNGYVKQTGDNVNNWLIGLGGGLGGPPSIPSDLALLAAPAATFSDRAPVLALHPA
jgi:hypothetical protein